MPVYPFNPPPRLFDSQESPRNPCWQPLVFFSLRESFKPPIWQTIKICVTEFVDQNTWYLDIPVTLLGIVSSRRYLVSKITVAVSCGVLDGKNVLTFSIPSFYGWESVISSYTLKPTSSLTICHIPVPLLASIRYFLLHLHPFRE